MTSRRGGPERPAARHPAGAEAFFFGACIGSLFAPEEDGGGAGGAAHAFLRLCERAHVPVAVPDGLGVLCCGTPWQSKGCTGGHRTMAARTLDVLWITQEVLTHLRD
ncbi:hypothetical protein [Streptomyces sp. NPDC056628]|uniref:hypothetical protein n=1 Tax=Streptomyces sp. NPDC056628 TaxID=3345882 RepID=UPI0036D03C0A